MCCSSSIIFLKRMKELLGKKKKVKTSKMDIIKFIYVILNEYEITKRGKLIWLQLGIT